MLEREERDGRLSKVDDPREDSTVPLDGRIECRPPVDPANSGQDGTAVTERGTDMQEELYCEHPICNSDLGPNPKPHEIEQVIACLKEQGLIKFTRFGADGEPRYCIPE